MWAVVLAPKMLGMSIARVLKSRPPARRLVIGIIMSLTSELTMAVKAPPTATPTARSTTLPRLINSLNSRTKELSDNFLDLGVDDFVLIYIL